MALDRSGPVLYVSVSNAGSQATTAIPADIRVMSMTFDEDEAKADKLDLSIDNHDLANFDTPLFAIGNVVTVQWGYPGAMSRVRTASITKVTGSLVLKVECKGKSHVANLVPKTRTFENMRRSDIAAQIAREHGLASFTQIDQTPEVIPHVAQSRETDQQFLRGLAHKEGYDYYEDNTGFHFHERKLGAKPIRRFTYYVDQAGGDVETFSIDGDIAAKPALVVHSGRDPLSKENFAPYANDASLAGRPTNAPVAMVNNEKLAAALNANAGGTTASQNVLLNLLNTIQGDPTAAGAHRTVSTAKDGKDAQAQADAQFKRAEQKALKITLNCVGDALIEAKQTIELVGFGRVISGNYHVTNVNHKVGPGYKMVIKATRSGVGAQTGMGGNAPDTDGKVNAAAGPPVANTTPVAVADKATGVVTFQTTYPKQ